MRLGHISPQLGPIEGELPEWIAAASYHIEKAIHKAEHGSDFAKELWAIKILIDAKFKQCSSS